MNKIDKIVNWKSSIEPKNSLGEYYHSLTLNFLCKLDGSVYLHTALTSLSKQDKVFNMILHIYVEIKTMTNYYVDPRESTLKMVDEEFFSFISSLDYKGMLWVLRNAPDSVKVELSNHELTELRRDFYE